MYRILFAIILSIFPCVVNAALTTAEIENIGTFSGTWTTEQGTHISNGLSAPEHNQVIYKMNNVPPSSTAYQVMTDYCEFTIPSGNISLSIVFRSGRSSSRCKITINGTEVSEFGVPYYGFLFSFGGFENYPKEYLITNDLGVYGAGPYIVRMYGVALQDYSGSPTDFFRQMGQYFAIDSVKYGNFNFGSVSGKMYPAVVASKSHYVLGGVKIGVYQGSNLITYGFTDTGTGEYKIYGLNTGTYTVKTADSKWQVSTEQTISVVSGSTTNVPNLYAVGHRIWTPGPAKPEIRKPKETFNIEFFGSSSCGSFTATLSNEYKTYAIPIEKVSYNSTLGLHTLKATIQSNVAESLYTLTVNSSEGNDSVVRAVKVVKNYKNKLYFLHTSDDHINIVDSAAVNSFREEVKLYNILRPEFVILTGDCFSDNTADDRNMKLFMEILNECEVPTFVTAGNHDRESNFLGDITTGNSCTIRDREIAILYWGPPFYSRNYGAYHLTAGDWVKQVNETSGFGLDTEWVNWLRNDYSKAQNAKLRISFAHERYSYYGEYSEEYNDWAKYRINMFLHGHNHRDGYNRANSSPSTVWLETKSMYNYSGTYYFSCRLIRIEDDSFVSWWYDDEANKTQSMQVIHPTMHIPFLTVNYSTAQNGSLESSSATITNQYNERFENAQIKFIVKRGTYSATGGTVVNMVHSDDKTITVVYVNVDIAKQSTQQVSITRVGDAVDEGITAKINYKEGGIISVTGFKGEVKLDIPAYTFASDTTLTLNTEPDLPAISGQGEYKGTNVGVEITAAAEGEMKYLKAMTLTIGYRNEDIVGLDENKLSIAYYNTTEKKWFVLPSKIHTDDNKVEATITHFSLFQVVEYGTPSNLDSVRVYPNPYQPSKHAQINFMGLTATSVIKIYTINGEKVNEVNADVRGNGIWDGNNSSGEKVGSGVYLGYITDGTNRKTVKICIER